MKHVLILSDLGKLNTLTGKLQLLLDDPSSVEEEQLRDLGRRLGGFFASLHSPETLAVIDKQHHSYFVSSSARDDLFSHILAQTRQQLKDLAVEDVAQLCARINEITSSL